MQKRNKHRIVIPAVLILLAGLLTVLLCQYFRNDKKDFLPEQRTAGNSCSIGRCKAWKPEYGELDRQLGQAEDKSYTGLILTSYRFSLFDKEAIQWGFGVKPLQAVWRTGSVHELTQILETVFREQPDMEKVFLELNPARHNDKKLIRFIRSHPETEFYIFFPPYPAEYWEQISERGTLGRRLAEYGDFSAKLRKSEHVKLFYFDDREWMTENPGFFKDGTRMSADGIFRMYSAFGAGECMVRGSQSFFPAKQKRGWKDFSGQTVFCFGDSMFDKDRGDSGVLETAAGFLNADVYNASVCGAGAAGEADRDFKNITDLLLSRNWEGISYAQPDIPAETLGILKKMQTVTPDYIVIGYGYNDYSAQVPPVPGKSGDSRSFEKALKENVERIRDRYPAAKIILSTAVTSTTDLGGNYPLKQYADAAWGLAEKEGIYCLYNYDDGELSAETIDGLLVDGVHFNDRGRFIQAVRLAKLMESAGTAEKKEPVAQP